MKLEWVEDIISSLGSTYICDWGYVEDAPPSSFKRYDEWVERGDYKPLHYMADHRKKLRASLKSYYPDFQSALVFLFSYSSEKKAQNNFYRTPESNGLKMASYALSFQGQDYHHLIKNELHALGEKFRVHVADLNYKLACDIHPVLDRDLAYRAGLGWFGKNSMLISPTQGSFCMIGALLFNKKLELPVRQTQTDHCGNCTACIEECPTLAIDGEKRQIVASRCISTYTIETFKQAPPIKGHVENGSGEIFGCDICQDVCPWNKRPLQKVQPSIWPSSTSSQLLKDFFLTRSPEEIEKSLKAMSKREYKRVFKRTSVERTGRDGLLKNIQLF